MINDMWRFKNKRLPVRKERICFLPRKIPSDFRNAPMNFRNIPTLIDWFLVQDQVRICGIFPLRLIPTREGAGVLLPD